MMEHLWTMETADGTTVEVWRMADRQVGFVADVDRPASEGPGLARWWERTLWFDTAPVPMTVWIAADGRPVAATPNNVDLWEWLDGLAAFGTFRVVWTTDGYDDLGADELLERRI